MKLDLTQFPLMGDATTQRLMDTFAAQGVPARFVGGCVRDAILGIAAHDIDIAVPLPPDEVMELLGKAGIKVIPTGYKFGTVTAVLGECAFQITSLRQDWATNGRHAQVIYGANWEEDARRRDFTINAFYADREGMVTDYFNGLADLHSGVIRFVGEAGQRIQEDYLRILRYFRFLAWYGHGSLNPEASEACANLREGLKSLSRERIGHEFLKLLGAPDPLPSLVLMDKSGIAPYILPHPFNLQALAALFQFDKEPRLLCRLAALSLPHIDSDGLAQALRLSGEQKQYLRHCQDRLDNYPGSEKTTGRNLYRDGVELFRDLTLLGLIQRPLGSTPSILQEALKVSAAWVHPVFPLNGQDLLEAGIKPGKKLGLLLKQCEDWWVDQNFQPGREACLRWVQGQVLSVKS